MLCDGTIYFRILVIMTQSLVHTKFLFTPNHYISSHFFLKSLRQTSDRLDLTWLCRDRGFWWWQSIHERSVGWRFKARLPPEAHLSRQRINRVIINPITYLLYRHFPCIHTMIFLKKSAHAMIITGLCLCTAAWVRKCAGTSPGLC